MAEFVLELEIFHKKVVEKIKTYTFIFTTFFFSENSPSYQVMWKNMVDPDMPHMTI